MATIKEFNALRFSPSAGRLEDLICGPYGAIGEEDRARLCEMSPYNLVRLELPREGRDPYEHVRNLVCAWLEDGILAADETPGIYLYAQDYTHGGERKILYGILCAVRLEEPESGVVLPHRRSRPGLGADRFNLLCATRLNTSPLHALFSDPDGSVLSRVASGTGGAPIIGLRDSEGITHRVWKLADAQSIAEISGLLSHKTLYVADGWHRYETALRYRDHLRRAEGDAPRDADWILMSLTAMEQPGLAILPLHRIIRGVSGFDSDELLEECGEYFSLQRMQAGELSSALEGADCFGEKALGLCLPGGSYLLTLRDAAVMKDLLPGAGEALCGLGSSILHALVLERLMGLEPEDMDNQRYISYTTSITEAISAVERGDGNCSFLLNPVKPWEIASVAAAGERMPRGSAAFFPGPAAGLVMAGV